MREKIAALRQRGIWMGGMPPLGYDVVERKLVPNPAEAQIVCEMFTRFAALPSMATLVRDLRERGVAFKSWTTAKGVERKGKLIDKGYVYKIFKNAVYIGIAAYKKGQKYYRYYINADAIKLGKDACGVRRMPAGEIETVVVEQLQQVLRSPEVLAKAIHEVTVLRLRLSEPGAIDEVWESCSPASKLALPTP